MNCEVRRGFTLHFRGRHLWDTASHSANTGFIQTQIT